MGYIHIRLCIPAIYARVRLGLGLTRSYKNESDWLIPGENAYLMIPGDELNVRVSLLTFMLKEGITNTHFACDKTKLTGSLVKSHNYIRNVFIILVLSF